MAMAAIFLLLLLLFFFFLSFFRQKFVQHISRRLLNGNQWNITGMLRTMSRCADYFRKISYYYVNDFKLDYNDLIVSFIYLFFFTTNPLSFGHCVVCSSIYGFWLPLWYLQTLLKYILQCYNLGHLWNRYYITDNWSDSQYMSCKAKVQSILK
jgi:hypothetical protein